MHFISLFIALSGALISTANAHLTRRVLHERLPSVPHGWSLHRRAPSEAIVPLRIGLRQSNLELLDDYLLDIADPSSENYGKLWTASQVADTFRPDPTTVEAVRAWLAADGVDSSRVTLSKDGGFLRAEVLVAEAERLLGADYFVYRHEESGAEQVGCHAGYFLPEHVAPHVDLVTPTVQFGRMGVTLEGGRSLTKRADATTLSTKADAVRPPSQFAETTSVDTGLDHCDEAVNLACIHELYDFYYQVTVPERNFIGVLELGSQTYNAADLDLFFKGYAPDMVGARPTLIDIDKVKVNNSQTTSIGESNLDFELVMGLLGKKQEVWYYQSSGYDTLLEALDIDYCHALGGNTSSIDCGSKPRANVISVSYGGQETGDINAKQRQCAEFGKLSLMGTTILYASGDNGVMGPSNHCVLSNGTLTDGKSGNFLPTYPATCPYITAVGAVQLPVGSHLDEPQIASGFGSGGGFSTIFPRPRWQNRAVGKYLRRHAPSYPYGTYNRTGRGFPDVSASGSRIAVASGGKYGTNGGTSASTPIFASMIAAVNDARIAAGKSPVGWINPALYSHRFAGVYTDIKNGSNPGCGTDGFAAVEGWDPVTGLGTPVFSKMLARFMMLP